MNRLISVNISHENVYVCVHIVINQKKNIGKVRCWSKILSGLFTFNKKYFSAEIEKYLLKFYSIEIL